MCTTSNLWKVQGKPISLAHRDCDWRDRGTPSGMVSSGEFSLKQTRGVSIWPIGVSWGLPYSRISFSSYGCARVLTKSFVYLYGARIRHHLHRVCPWRPQSAKTLASVSSTNDIRRPLPFYLSLKKITVSSCSNNQLRQTSVNRHPTSS